MQCDKKHSGYWKALFPIVLLVGLAPVSWAEDPNSFLDGLRRMEMHGFLEARTGIRTQRDPYEKDISVMEVRLQGEFLKNMEWFEFKYKGDVWGDGITQDGEYDTREAWCFARPSDFLDVKIGRQVLTWGTGDLVFLNDLFPKDWQSYFIGRDKEYLKAPSDVAKISLFTELASLDMVYAPKFNPDRYITGEYISYWNEDLDSLAGRNAIVVADKPDRWFEDDEAAVRIYSSIDSYELALYGYWGFWKSPGGETTSGISIFPALNVYGGSVRGRIGPGIGNVELAYYQSADDEDGSNPRINNSEMRYLIGYTQDLAKDCNVSLQYYVEYMLDYSAYKANLKGGPVCDQDRHVVTVQLTKLLMNQNLAMSLSGYYSPSDMDAYLRPTIHYKYTDKITFEGGANIFLGSEPYTFFGQFENDTNIYVAIRYSF